MEPALVGAVAVMVKADVPLAELDAMPAVKVTLQVNFAPGSEGKLPQFNVATLVLRVTAVAITPAGSCSLTVTLVPEVAEPLLPSLIVYVMVPPVATEAVAVFDKVKFDPTVVRAEPQLAAGEQLAPGVGGEPPPDGSTDA